MSRSARSGTREEILDAASRLFAATGFKGTSLQDIAGAVGCSKAALLYHFDGKDAILTELLAPAVGAFEELEARLAALDDGAVRLAAVEGFVDLVMRFRREVTVLYGDLPDLLQRPAFAGVQEMKDRLLDALAGRSPAPAARAAALMVLGGVPVVCMEPCGIGDAELRSALVRGAARALDPSGV
ncbi:TetR/AcrR family transcriptional regulator [Planomonospora sp. ID82291]|uniref:TetR/AcrR family transcriptional regulator n=1 Tax=Planomonospora sp. ID82291 TaxID=2738136 RepID=UPI0018C3EE8E|nr:TetR/AcrR family transcriptional regulator [Planomonospora sp. ID82291]MBG0817153.1 TetR/AcrR family transcriptional regulator [Planomonospora sp. ID82291]